MDILLVCYSFPPFPGIGGRRWAKFAKYLTRNGHKLHVICADESAQDRTSPWLPDVADNPNITRHVLPAKFPVVLTREPRNIIDKVMYRVWWRILMMKGKGDFLDRAVLWGPQVRAKATQLIKQHNIKNVIVTVGPFHLGYHVAVLKKQFPELNMLVDMRDPWTRYNEEWSFGTLNPKRKAEEEGMEADMVRHCDHLISVYDKTVDYLKEKVPDANPNYVVVPNGFDYEDFEAAAGDSDNPYKDKIRFVFTGTLYNMLDYLIDPLLESLQRVKQEQPELYAKLQFDFFGNTPSHYEEKRAAAGVEAITFHGLIPLHQVYREVKHSDFCMLFLIKNYAFSQSTKFYEYISQGKKIVVFSEPGEMPDRIARDGIGYKVYPETFHEDFVAVLNAYDTPEFQQQPNIDISGSDVKVLLEKIEACLK